MELNFEKTTLGIGESAMTEDGVKVTFVHRTKSLVIVYYGKTLIAECRNRDEAIAAVSKHIDSGVSECV